MEYIVGSIENYISPRFSMLFQNLVKAQVFLCFCAKSVDGIGTRSFT